MACVELDLLREAARKLYRALDDKVRKSQAWPGQQMSGSVYKTDYESYLKHRLTLITGEIMRHLAQHKCEEPRD